MRTYRSRRHDRIILLLLMLPLVLPLVFCPATAQTSPAPIVPMHGVGDDEFLISSNVATYPDSGGIGKLWEFARAMGISTLMPGASVNQIDTLVNDTLEASKNRLIIRGIDPVQLAGAGREVQFYPFDSVQVPLYKWLFTDRSGGTDLYNALNDPERSPVREREYNSSNTIPGQLILKDIVYDWRPWQTNRFPAFAHDSTAHNASDFIEWYRYRWQTNSNKPTFNIVVTGHILDNGSADEEDSLLKIEIIYEIPAGMQYQIPAGVPHLAETDTSYLYTTAYVKKASLAPLFSSTPNYNEYRDTSIAIDFAQCAGCPPGPMYGPNESRRFNLRVYWTGAEAVALRSIALRDSIGELVMGNRQPSVDFRASMLNAARRVVYGTTTPDSTAEPRQTILRIMSGIEQHPMESSMFAAVEDLLRKNLRTGFAPGDSISCHTEGGTSTPGVPTFHHITYSDAVFPEIGLATPIDTSTYYAGNGHSYLQATYKLENVRLPSIAQHNGNRFQIPLLNLTRQAIESDYEPALQINKFGHYDPRYPYDFPYPWKADVMNLGQGAEIMRDKGRRMISTVFPTCELHLRVKKSGDPLDTMMTHTPEAAELRAMVNLSLCYGARGIHYYWLGNYTNYMYRSPVDSNLWIGVNDSWGPNGPLTNDTLLDWSPAFHLTDNIPTPTYPNGTPRVTLNNFYVGYRVRTRELRKINSWLAEIGPEMAKLRWRDAYSMHAAVRHPNMDSPNMMTRPLPNGEIVTGIQTFSPDGTPDTTYATYVELGLFETQLGRDTSLIDSSVTLNPLKDVNHIFVVNRRTFERPEDISAASDSGRTMDSLAETRTIRIGFNLRHPDTTQYNFIRVREVVPDTLPLALTGTSRRWSLDTVVHDNGVVDLTLRPGGGALLRITYCPPDTSIVNGDLQTNSQRKLLYFNDRYHMVFWRKSPGPPAKDTVLYRRSLRTSQCCGAILWEPKEYVVSPRNPSDSTFANDCYPSLTARNINGDTVVTVVWTNRNTAVPDPRRYIWMRNILVNEGEPQVSGKTMVARYRGIDPQQWGTPVVSSAHGGDIIAWSDSSVGIVAAVRKLDAGVNGWSRSGQLSRLDSASLYDPSYGGGFDMFPTMPAFTHVRSLDSNVGMAWQRIFPVSEPPISGIMYMRLEHADSTITGRDSLINHNYTWLSTTSERAFHPSMDMAQGIWNNVYEGVTWESLEPATSSPGGWDTWLNFRSLWTPTNERDGWDRIDPTWLWGLAQLRVAEDQTWSLAHPYLLPNTSSTNSVYDSDDSNESLIFSVAYVDPAGGMRQAKIKFSEVNFQDDAPQYYAFGGKHPNGSASTLRQPKRHAVIYESLEPGGKHLRSTREFFPKMRPQDYMASGRRAALLLDTSAHTGISVMLHDPWKADPSGAGGIKMAVRGFQDSVPVQNLTQMSELLRTGYFHSYDSTVLGLELSGHYFGDYNRAPDATLTAVAELVDSATHNVICQLDSFTISAATPTYGVRLEPTLDLLSGTYYVRLRIDTSGITGEIGPEGVRYSVAEVASEVRAEMAGKLRRVDRSADAGRISVWPNPASGSAEIQFSVPTAATTSVTIYDAGGRQVFRPVESAPMEPGRYSILTDLSSLPGGTYLLELNYTTGTTVRRAVGKMVITR